MMAGDGSPDQNVNGSQSLMPPYHKEPSKTASVILLNGFPGVGKSAIGQELFRLFGSANARFLDNHLLIDPVQAILPGRDTGHKSLRREFRRVAFTALKELQDPDVVIILTGCLGSTQEDLEVFYEHLQIAVHRCIPMYLVNITCEEKEHLSRLTSTERSQDNKTKLQNQDTLHDLLRNHTLIQPKVNEISFTMDVDLRLVELDSSGLSIAESAADIWRRLS